MNKLIPIGICIGLALIGVLGDYFIKLSGTGQKYMEVRLFAIGALIYSLTAIGWFFVMKDIKLSTLAVFYSITTILALVLIGTIFFKESLHSTEIVGIMLAIASLIILARHA